MLIIKKPDGKELRVSYTGSALVAEESKETISDVKQFIGKMIVAFAPAGK